MTTQLIENPKVIAAVMAAIEAYLEEEVAATTDRPSSRPTAWRRAILPRQSFRSWRERD